MSIFPDDDTDSTESDNKYDSEHDPDVDMLMEDDVNEPDGVDLNGDADTRRDSGDEEVEDEHEEDEDEVEDTDEEEDKDEDDRKKPRTISQEDMVNTSADNVETMVDNQSIVVPEQRHGMRIHTPRLQPPAPAPWPQTPEHYPWPWPPETHPLSGLQHLGLLTTQNAHPAVPALQKVEAAGNTSDVDVEQQLLGESAGGDCHFGVPLHNSPHTEAHLDSTVGEE